jgi:ABC-2 type transport system permease protein
MNKLLLIIKREYFSRVTKRSFILTTLLVPLGLAVLPVVIFFLARSNDADKIAVVDESGIFANKFNNSRLIAFSYETLSLDELKKSYKEKKYDGILYIPKFETNEAKGIRYYSSRSLGFTANLYLQGELSREIEKLKLNKAGLEEKLISDIKSKISVETIIMSEGSEKSDNKIVALVTAFIMGIIIYITLIIYGVMVMNGVVEEKANRIMEVIVSSVKPFQMLTGKILGIAAVGLTQLAGWIIISVFLVQIALAVFGGQLTNVQPETLAQSGVNARDAEAMSVFMKNLDSINFTELFVLFIFYFFGGYLFYASLYAAAASGANDPGDVQSLSFPVTIPIIIAFFIMQIAANDPHGVTAFWGSMIPFTSPIVMLARIPYGVPLWQTLLSMACLIGGFVSTTWLAAKIYRVGILMYGKKITLKELGKWVFYKG